MDANNTPIATVASLQGQAWARSADGTMRPLSEGDQIYRGETVVTADGGRVDLLLPDGSLYPVQGELLAQLTPEEAASQNENSEGEVQDQTEKQEQQDGVGTADDPATWGTPPVIQRTGEFSDEPSGYIRVAKDQGIAESQYIEGGNSFAMPPVLSVSIVGDYNEGIGSRSGGYDEFLDGRATYNPRIIETTFEAAGDEFVEALRIEPDFEGDEGAPVINTIPEIGVPEDALVDEDDLDEGNDNEPPKESTVVGGSLAVIPAGEGLDTTFDPGNEPPSGLESAGQQVQYYISPDGHTLIGYVGSASGEPDESQWAFTVVINDPGSDAGAQSYTFTLLDQLDHPDAQGENELVLPFTFTVQDESGDEVSSGFNVTVIDDIPVASGSTTVGYVEEEALDGGNDGDSDVGGINGDSDGDNAVWSGSLSSLFSAGADQPGSYGLNAVPTGLPSLTSDGETVVYDVTGNTLTAYVDSGSSTGSLDGTDRVVFTFEITDTTTGAYEFTLEDQIDHHEVGSADDIETLQSIDLSGAVYGYDEDGDEQGLDASSVV
ncbi:retention module-containing protein, partial [Prosthecochloris sp. N2]